MSKILLCNGQMLDILNPDPAVITVDVIAHSLSKLARFNGHTTRFYSVAQHSMLACRIGFELGDVRLAMTCLLHDAAEAFIGDIPTPVKRLIDKDGQLRAIEDNLLRAVWEALGITGPFYHATLWAKVDKIDADLLEVERKLLLPPSSEWPPVVPDYLTASKSLLGRDIHAAIEHGCAEDEPKRFCSTYESLRRTMLKSC